MFDILKFKNILKKKNYAKEYDGVINVDVFNPERGIYEQRHTKVSDYQPLDLESLKRCKEVKKESLILRMFNLDALRETEHIPLEILEKIDRDFEIARQAGVKLIIRFCYTEDIKEPDAPKRIVISHIQELKPILHKNSDVIYAMQAGFIGTWGEWYYTNDDFGNKSKMNEVQEANRKEVVKYLLDILPKDRFLLMRTPKYKMNFLGHTRTITTMDIQARNDNYRIGFHNDAFLADDSDMGTYTSDNDKTYLAFDSRYVPVLGETCKPGPQANGQRAINQMAYYHWNALNRQYHPTVIEGWKEDGTYPEIKSRLGYRLVLIYSEIDHYATLNKTINLKLAIANDGFSAPVYPKAFFVVIENRETQVRYTIKPKNNPDVREFYPDQTTEINLELDLSEANPPLGKYNVYLDISDTQFLHRPDYRIVFVNVDMEEPETRLNNLGIYFSIKEE
ncbi:hypothetical protein BCR32DRAFT_296923 [Anaeromyces robustus]|jgi:hypothetical protein|uniref:DUF4832 domain-containing protein n=1 Tax=Anaeromyces robustus TaxID=1754192 RepID=A0A1Y1WQ67_9FUNG|nr:hypothetical protein BCR32DRAFT_296923 [Anaeromyces robustus]|eukprot:ORX75406.1 hypothetical protein BCR32DRAFT_296923 [Anaeromyces robustus]